MSGQDGKNGVRCKPGIIESLRLQKGLTVEALAAATGVGERTIYRLSKGGRSRLENVDLIARKLGVPLSAVLDAPAVSPPPPVVGTRYSLHITISGTTDTPEQNLALLGATPSAANHITKAGGTVESYECTIASTPENGLKHRALVVVWCQMPDDTPAWAIVAVRPEALSAFLLAEVEGQLDVYKLEPFGEVVCSAEGLVPPDEVIAKVAAMFRADVWQLRLRTMVRTDIHGIKAGIARRTPSMLPDRGPGGSSEPAS